MTKLENITKEDIWKVLQDYFAKPEKRQQMSMDEALQLAKKLNHKINVPIINETKEEKIILKMVMAVDTFLYDHLPNEFYDLVRSLEDGIDEQEAGRLIKRLTDLACSKINIPYVPKLIEKFIIKFIITVIINAARKDWDFTIATNSSDSLNPSSNRFTEILNNQKILK